MCSAGDPSSIPGSERSPGEGKGYPLQYPGLENSMDCTVHGATKSQTQLSDFHRHNHYLVHLQEVPSQHRIQISLPLSHALVVFKSDS